MRYDAILFDFDGTIADTMPGIHQALQYAAGQMGCAPVDDALARKFIGPPILDSAQRYLGLTAEQAARFYDLFREVYGGEAFFMRVRDGYDLLAETNPQRIKRIDASHDIETVTREACAHIDRLLSGR